MAILQDYYDDNRSFLLVVRRFKPTRFHSIKLKGQLICLGGSLQFPCSNLLRLIRGLLSKRVPTYLSIRRQRRFEAVVREEQKVCCFFLQVWDLE